MMISQSTAFPACPGRSAPYLQIGCSFMARSIRRSGGLLDGLADIAAFSGMGSSIAINNDGSSQ